MSSSERFIHSPAARLIALGLSVGLFAIIYTNWSDEIQQEIASFSGEEGTPLVHEVGVERVNEDHPELASCLAERVGHVDQMLSDGLISEEQHGTFATRATALCTAQHSG